MDHLDPGSLPFHHYRPRAGHPDWPRLLAEARQLADELRPGLERPRSPGVDLRRKASSIATFARNYRRNRTLHREGREDLRPLFLLWTLLRTCNFDCSYCDDHRGEKYPDLPDDGVLDTARGIELLRVMRTGTSSVYFAGGEPTVRRDLPVLTRAARDLDYFPIIVNTNGSLLHSRLRQAEWRTWLADMDTIIVSLDALDLDLLDTMWGTRRSEHVIRNLLVLRELASEMRFKLMVNTVIQPGRLDEGRAVVDLVNDLGIWLCPVPQNRGPRIDPALRDDPGYRELAELVLDRQARGHRVTGSRRMNRRFLFSEPLDCRNTLKPHVDVDGRLAWPCKASVHVEPERIDVLAFEDVDALYEHAVTRVDPTRFHGPAPNQCGGDCNWAQNYATDAYAHGVAHPASLVGELVDFLGA